MSEIHPDKIKFYEFLNGDLPSAIFESWIYRSKKLELILTVDDYFDLIEFNFKSHEFIPFIKSLVKKNFDWKEYELWRTTKLLESIKKGEMELVLATRNMKAMYLEQIEEIKVPLISKELALGFESVLDDCPIASEYHLWKAEALEKQLEPVQFYKAKILEMVEQELEEISKR